MRIKRSDVFLNWHKKLRDSVGKQIIDRRIDQFSKGNPGEVEPIGEGCSEMKIHYGPGQRVYFKDTGKEVILLLCGGDESTQQNDIEKAKKIARAYEEE